MNFYEQPMIRVQPSPCPGCGGTRLRRVKGMLCGTCQGKLDLYDENRSEIAALKRRLQHRAHDSFRSTAFELPKKLNVRDGTDVDMSELAEAFVATIVAVSEPLQDGERHSRDDWGQTGRTSTRVSRLVPKAALHPWQRLVKALPEACRAFYAAGVAEGRNLLAGLQNGELTVETLEQAATHKIDKTARY